MNQKPLFSVLVANYNNGQYLEESIQSIYDQSYNNWEIVIVDDYSSDNSHEVYEKLKKNSQIRIYYSKKNEGCGSTKARCIDHANGEICGFLDPDDTYTKDAIEVMVEAHLKNPSCSMVHSKLLYCDENLNIQSEYMVGNNVAPRQPFFFNLEGEITQLTTFKKSMYLKTEGIDRYFQRAVDQDLYFKLYEVGDTLYINKCLYLYRVHNKGISTFDNSPKAHFWKWFAILEAAKRRNVNVEELFLQHFVSRKTYYLLFKDYKRLYKYSKLNDFLHKLNCAIRFKKIDS